MNTDYPTVAPPINQRQATITLNGDEMDTLIAALSSYRPQLRLELLHRLIDADSDACTDHAARYGLTAATEGAF